MYPDFNSSDSGSTDQMLQNIASSMDQPPPPSNSSDDSIAQIILKIMKASTLPTSYEYISSPSDVSLVIDDPGQKTAAQHLQQYQQMMDEHEILGGSSDDMEYQPSLPAIEDDLGSALGLGGADGLDEGGADGSDLGGGDGLGLKGKLG